MQKTELTNAITKACENCAHCGMQADSGKALSLVCRAQPPTTACAWVPAPGGLELKVATVWTPVGKSDWCGKFEQRLNS